jgi:curved DNA-binding protein CbpA
MDDFYELLEVPEDASRGEIKEAWREKAGEYHPDVNDDDRAAAQFKTLKKAYEVLSDDTERSAYDRMGHSTYVSKRLDGLPTAGMSRPESSSGGNRWQRGSTSTASSRGESRTSSRSSGPTGTRNTTRTSASSQGSRSSSTTDASRSRTGSSRSRSRTGSSQSRSNAGRSATSAQSTSGTSSRAGETRSTGASAEVDDDAAASTGTARSPLWYGWTAVFLAGLAYLTGVGVYLRANLGALTSLSVGVAADPSGALLANHGLTAPGTFVLASVTGVAGPALAFPAGAVLLAVVFAATVVKFGHGSAYLYLLGAVAPLSSFALGPAVSVPAAGAALALVVALPVGATVVFLVDVGRFLVAGR